MKRLFSVVLAAALLIGTLPVMAVPTAFAADTVGVFEYEDELYYLDWTGVPKGGKVYITEAGGNGYVSEGYYYVDDTGRFYSNEFAAVDGNLHYFENGQISAKRGATEIDGNLYYISWDGVVQTGKVHVVQTNGLVTEGDCYTDKNGRFCNYEFTTIDGNLYYIEENGQLCDERGVTRIDGNLYYISWNGIVQTGKVWVSSGNGLTATACWVYTDENGRLYTEEFATIDGNRFYMVNGQPYAESGVREIGGERYYLAWNGAVQSGKIYITNTNDLVEEGWYYTDENGRIGGNEFVTVDGKIYYVENGQLCDERGMTEINGHYYYIGWDGVVQTGKVWAVNTNGLVAEGYHYMNEAGQLEDFSYTINDNQTVTITSYNTDFAEVVVPSTIEGYPVTAINSGVFNNKTHVRTVVIPDGVTSVGKFANCPNLISVSLPDSVKSLGGFSNCSSLSSVVLPKNITSLGSGMFSNCGNLRSLTFMGMVSYIDRYTFTGCDSIKDIYVNCTSTEWSEHMMNSYFSPGSGLSAVTYHYTNDAQVGDYQIRWFEGGTATIMGYTGSETAIVIPSELNGYAVTVINGSAFYGCTGLTGVTIPEGVKTIGASAFYGCTGLVSVTIPNSVTSIGNSAFAGCNRLSDVYYGGSEVGWAKVSIGTNNSILTSATIHYALDETIPQYEYEINSDGTATITMYNGSSDELIVPSQIDGYTVTAIGDSAFYGYKTMTSISLPSTVTSIGASAFYGCNNLKSITIPSNVKSVGENAFANCSALADVTSSGGGIAFADNAFLNCTAIQQVTISDVTAWCQNTFADYDSNPLSSGANLCINGALITNLIISKDVTEIPCYAFYGCESMLYLTVNGGVMSVETMAFQNCSNLRSVTFPNSLVEINSNAFYNCSSLIAVTIRDGVKSIGSSAFYGCNSLTSITIPSSVTSIGNYAFYGCSSLTSITVPNGVTYIGAYAFYNCSGLTTVTIPPSVTIIGSCAFYGCTAIETVYISDLTAWCNISFAYTADKYYYKDDPRSNPLSYGAALYLNGEPLTELVIPESITIIKGYAFFGCTSITSAVIHSGVTRIDTGALYECSNLTDVYYDGTQSMWNDVLWPAVWGWWPIGSVTMHYTEAVTTTTTLPTLVDEQGVVYYTYSDTGTATVTDYTGAMSDVVIASEIGGYTVTAIDDSAFGGDTTLTSVVIPDSVISLDTSVFSGCSKLTDVVIGDGLTSIPQYAFYGCSSLKNVDFGNSVTYLSSSVFYYCSGLTSLVIPDTVKTIGSTEFYGCTSLKEITIGSGVTSIGSNAFQNCSALESVNITSLTAWCKISFGGTLSNPFYYADTLCLNGEAATELVIPDSVTTISAYAFYGCDTITNITIPEGVRSIGSYAFYNCSGLTSLVIPDSVTSVGDHVFGNCTSLTDVEIGSGLKTIAKYMFIYCSGLKVVTIPDTVTTIDKLAFYHCTGLTYITFGSGVNTINSQAFEGCTSLIKVTIPDGVTSISNSVFWGCSSLVSVTIPASVTSIGNQAFRDCKSLTDVYFGGTAEQWANVTIDLNNSYLTSATIHYADESA